MEFRGDVDKFRLLCENSSFPHREAILKGIDAHVYSLVTGPGEVSAESMLGIYRRRKAHLEKFKESDHAKQMVSDVGAYVDELEALPGERIKLWSLSFDDRSSYSLFAGEMSGRILGCIYGVDRRKLTTGEWDRLWGKVQVDGSSN